MSEQVIQTSFAAGELSPNLLARTDLAMYRQGLANCRNFFVDYRSGISSRQGTAFVLQCRSLGSRLVPFSVTTTTTYMIEFGDHYCRFFNKGAAVLEAPFAVSGISNAFPAVATVPGNNFVVGDWIFVQGVIGMPQINGRYFQVLAITGSQISLADVNGNSINSTAFGVYSSGGTASRVYTIPSPFAAADLFPSASGPGIKFAQSVSVLYITHPNYPPTTLSFASATNWFFTTLAFGSTIAAPTGLNAVQQMSAAPTTALNINYAFVVTAVDANGQESPPSAIFNLNNQNDSITIHSGTITLTWNAVPGAVSYNIYATEFNVGANGGAAAPVPVGAAFGFVTSATSPTTIITQLTIDFTTSPEFTNVTDPFSGSHPGCVSFFQQRVYYGGSNGLPASFFASQPGAFQNFNESNPIQASDTITGTIVSNQLNQIRHMLPMPGGLIFLTGRSAYTLTTGQGANATLAVTPLNATLMPQAYNGSSDVAPIVVNEDILYVQAKGSIVRDLSYNIYAAIYTGTDISVRSNHLFFGRNILQWTYAEEPFKIVWSVRDDGILLALTFVKEQQIIGWSRHDTQGFYKSVSSIQEGQVDAPYFIVRRVLPNGTVVDWVERMQERTLTYGAEDAWAVDAGTRSALPTPNANLVVTGTGSGAVTIVADAPVFSSASVGQVLRAGGGIVTITAFSSAQQISGTIKQVFTDLAPRFGVHIFSSGSWSIATPATKFFGLDYLIGQTVAINADGGVVTPQVVASDGSITLASPATKVTAGLGFQCQAQTMPLETGEPTSVGKRKKIGAYNIRCSQTRGLKMGRTLSTLVAFKDMNNSVPLGSPIPLITGDDRLVSDALWDVPGQFWFQLDDPLPATILGVAPEVAIGDTK